MTSKQDTSPTGQPTTPEATPTDKTSPAATPVPSTPGASRRPEHKSIGARPGHRHPHGHISGKALALLAVTALGVVYGDIGTSPLYAFRECFSGHYGIEATPDNVLGVLSLI